MTMKIYISNFLTQFETINRLPAVHNICQGLNLAILPQGRQVKQESHISLVITIHFHSNQAKLLQIL